MLRTCRAGWGAQARLAAAHPVGGQRAGAAATPARGWGDPAAFRGRGRQPHIEPNVLRLKGLCSATTKARCDPRAFLLRGVRKQFNPHLARRGIHVWSCHHNAMPPASTAAAVAGSLKNSWLVRVAERLRTRMRAEALPAGSSEALHCFNAQCDYSRLRADPLQRLSRGGWTGRPNPRC